MSNHGGDEIVFRGSWWSQQIQPVSRDPGVSIEGWNRARFVSVIQTSDWLPYRTYEPESVEGLPPNFVHDKGRYHA